jgi:hypothetical protein
MEHLKKISQQCGLVHALPPRSHAATAQRLPRRETFSRAAIDFAVVRNFQVERLSAKATHPISCAARDLCLSSRATAVRAIVVLGCQVHMAQFAHKQFSAGRALQSDPGLRSTATTFEHVSHVLCVRADKQMQGLNATSHVARVTKNFARRNRTNEQLIDDTVGLFRSESAVPTSLQYANPEPTTVVVRRRHVFKDQLGAVDSRVHSTWHRELSPPGARERAVRTVPLLASRILS